MMFTHKSRYCAVETAVFSTVDGREHSYKRRRFLPDPADMHARAEVTVIQGERLDMIAAQSLGDSEHFWRICDMNHAMNPSDLTGEIGRKLIIPLPGFES